MSNALAIAAVTATLRTILQSGINAVMSGVSVTILPLDKARVNNQGHQINLFLYQVVRNAAWANRDMPLQVQPGETGFPPLPLDLHYLITAFGQDNDVTNPSGHELLGVAMSLLHDHPVLSAEDIQAANLTGSDLDKQIEKMRVTWHPLSLDEMSKLWTGFSSQYRLSAAYQVGVALIESTRGTKTALPVLTRGKGDTGVSAQADLTPPLPTLETLAPLNPPSAQLGEAITLTGFHLDGTSVSVQFQHASGPTRSKSRRTKAPTPSSRSRSPTRPTTGRPASITSPCWCSAPGRISAARPTNSSWRSRRRSRSRRSRRPPQT